MDIRYKLSCGRKLGQATPSRAAMQQIADWFKKLGISEYTERFVENQHDLNYGDTTAVPHGARVFSQQMSDTCPWIYALHGLELSDPVHNSESIVAAEGRAARSHI